MEKEQKEKAPSLEQIMAEINEVLVKHKCTARDILHVATELSANAQLSLVFANIYATQQAQKPLKKTKKEA